MMSRTTGERLTPIAHLQQSVGDILATPIGSRVMRHEYGSLVPALLDQPDNIATQTRVFSAVVSALMRWEPRLKLDKVAMRRDPLRPGRADIEITGSYINGIGREAAPITLAVPLGQGGTA